MNIILLSELNKFKGWMLNPSLFYAILCAHMLFFYKNVCAIHKLAIPLHRRKNLLFRQHSTRNF